MVMMRVESLIDILMEVDTITVLMEAEGYIYSDLTFILLGTNMDLHSGAKQGETKQ